MQLIVNNTRQEYLSPVKISGNDTLSLPDMGQGDSHILIALAVLLDYSLFSSDIMASSWRGDSIEIISDEDPDVLDLFDLVEEEYEDITEEVMEAVDKLYFN